MYNSFIFVKVKLYSLNVVKLKNLMLIKTQHFVIFLTFLFCISCQQKDTKLREIHGKEIAMVDSIPEVDSIKTFITPYRDHIKEILDTPLAYAPKTMQKTDGELNSSIGNFIADLTFEISNPVFEKRTGNNIDFVLLNHGGIRAIISQGEVSRRTAYQVMPFENRVLILELSGEKVIELLSYLAKSKTAHPISKQLELHLNDRGEIAHASIAQKPIDVSKSYFVATSDFLANGGDHMDFFKNPINTTDIEYLLRNEIIDYFMKTDTLKASVDQRFIQIK
ncbi:putative 5'-nucleotidase/2',3'-cyclic phosphodiesterase [Galbibacter marinus]|uniref:Putative 5'-nucleotidase/2',3'-cyclic phosphodiesterase n=2 Tax=Galbibacter marinus TaxID=555500 RepID=K2P2Y2_9FLAO|nr:putative 5'-nucleotidase/2',3'-cyclic phosphodiesterase [Galbibacter marinus]